MELIQKLGLGLFGLGARRASTGSGAQSDARTRSRQTRQERDSGDSQQRYRHALPRTAKPVAARINLTFRRILPAG